MAEKDRFTLSREQAASKIRSKVTGFNFEDAARANIATAKMLGDVASSFTVKTEEQNKRFDRLLKVLDFLPKDQLERRKQQKEVFVNLARLTADVEQQARETMNPVKVVQLHAQARTLRRQGHQFGGDYNSADARGLKENFAEKFLNLSPQQIRQGGGILGAYSDELDRVTGFKKVAGFITGKKDDAFSRQIEQERLYPQISDISKKASIYARRKGNISNTDETGLNFREKGSSGPKVPRQISYGPILRQMTHTLIEIRNAVTGKGGSAPSQDVMADRTPKNLLSPEEKDIMDPRNWGVKMKGAQKGRKFWNKRDSNGRIVKPEQPWKQMLLNNLLPP